MAIEASSIYRYKLVTSMDVGPSSAAASSGAVPAAAEESSDESIVAAAAAVSSAEARRRSSSSFTGGFVGAMSFLRAFLSDAVAEAARFDGLRRTITGEPLRECGAVGV